MLTLCCFYMVQWALSICWASNNYGPLLSVHWKRYQIPYVTTKSLSSLHTQTALSVFLLLPYKVFCLKRILSNDNYCPWSGFPLFAYIVNLSRGSFNMNFLGQVENPILCKLWGATKKKTILKGKKSVFILFFFLFFFLKNNP